jgi:hypothetical protein
MSNTKDQRGLSVWQYCSPSPEADARLHVKGFETLQAARAELEHRVHVLESRHFEAAPTCKEVKALPKPQRCETAICPFSTTSPIVAHPPDRRINGKTRSSVCYGHPEQFRLRR